MQDVKILLYKPNRGRQKKWVLRGIRCEDVEGWMRD